MANVGAPLVLLAALGVALAVAGPGGGAPPAGADRPAVGDAAAPAPVNGLDPGFALRVSVAGLAISLERRCPPPAILACRPAIRISGRLGAAPSPDPGVRVEMNLETLGALLENPSP